MFSMVMFIYFQLKAEKVMLPTLHLVLYLLTNLTPLDISV